MYIRSTRYGWEDLLLEVGFLATWSREGSPVGHSPIAVSAGVEAVLIAWTYDQTYVHDMSASRVPSGWVPSCLAGRGCNTAIRSTRSPAAGGDVAFPMAVCCVGLEPLTPDAMLRGCRALGMQCCEEYTASVSNPYHPPLRSVGLEPVSSSPTQCGSRTA